jgi:hypothetical protein
LGRIETRPEEQEGTNITFIQMLQRYVEEGELKDIPPVKWPLKPRVPRQRTEEARCPYCYALLNSAPSRKKKCPFCGGIIFLRHQTEGCVHVLATAEQIKEAALELKYHKQLARMIRGKETKTQLKLRQPSRVQKEKTTEEIIARLEKHRESLQTEIESIEVCSWWFPKALHSNWKQLKAELQSLDERITELKKLEEPDKKAEILSQADKPGSRRISKQPRYLDYWPLH